MEQTPIPMLDLKAQYSEIQPEIDQAITRVVASQHFINGPDVAAFEAELADYCRTEHAVGLSSGSDAVLVALLALDIGAGDEVITTPYTFFASVGAIARLGARPVFVDIDPATFNLDAGQIESRITPRTRAILPVHLFGQCAEMAPILATARRHGLAVVEDAAQALGAEYQGRRAGTLGTMGCFSFFPSKNLGGYGDGGAIVTGDRALADKIRCLRAHGSSPKYFHKMIGGNFRLDTIQAAVLRVKLKHLDAWTAARRARAAYYQSAFALPFSSPLTKGGPRGVDFVLPSTNDLAHAFNQYVVRLPDRDGIRQSLKQRRIDTEVYYPRPMHLQECFASLGYRAGDFPESERASIESLALPIYPEMKSAQQDWVVQAIHDHFDRQGKARAA